MIDIMALGELLIDLTQSGTDDMGHGRFTAYPGGAPANVAVAAARLGARTGFIGKIGEDAFGDDLRRTLEKEGVDTSGLYTDRDIPTTLAIASIDAAGERSFSFYRDPGADTQLTVSEAAAALSETQIGILHIGSLSMTTSPSREACEEAVKFARKQGALISYDPNYRESLWDNEAQAVEMMKKLLTYTDILKVSDEEMAMLTGTDNLEEGSQILTEYGIKLVMVTMGSKGAFVRYGECTEHVPGLCVKVADTNGAGDTFAGAMLAQISKTPGGLEGLEFEQLLESVRYANKAASITCSRHGAIPAMPYEHELQLI